jgi:hypothetical protein
MADATSTLVIQARADVNDAVAGLNRLDSTVDKTSKTASGFGEQFRAMTGALITTELAMRAVGAAAQFVSSSIGEAIAADKDLQVATAATTAQIGALQAAFGNLVIGGEQGAEAVLLLNDVLGDLTDVLLRTGESGSIAMGVVNGLVTGLETMANVVDGGVLAWESFRILVVSVTASAFALGQGITGIARALADLTVNVVGQAIEGFAGLLEGTVQFARSVRAGGLLPEGVDDTITSIRSLGAELRAGTDPMARLNETGQGIAGTFQQLGAEFQQSRETVQQTFAATETFRVTLSQTRTATDDLTTATRSLTTARQEAIAAMTFGDEEGLKLGTLETIDPKTATAQIATKLQAEQEAVLAAALDTKTKLQGILESQGSADGGKLLTKQYDGAKEALSTLAGGAQSLGGALESGLGAALASTESFGKAFQQALGQSLVGSGIQTALEGAKALIPLPGLFNPAAAAVAIPLGFAMIGAGRLLGGSGSAPKGGSASTGPGSSGITPAAPSVDRTPVRLIDYTGATIVTNDVDSMRTLTNRMTTTAAAGAGARI